MSINTAFDRKETAEENRNAHARDTALTHFAREAGFDLSHKIAHRIGVNDVVDRVLAQRRLLQSNGKLGNEPYQLNFYSLGCTDEEVAAIQQYQLTKSGLAAKPATPGSYAPV